MIVLSLCDGMSCGRLAFEKAGIPVEKYFASEIKDIAIKVTMNNFPDTVQIGDVNKVHYENGVLHTENGNFETPIDIVIFGSPCQTFSVAMKTELRVGLQNKEKSGLFLECYRILKEVNPKFFFMENVARMKKEDKDFITKLMGVQPIKINSSLLSAQLREREYWTNIPNISQPTDKGIELQSVLTSGYTERKKSRALLVSDSRPLTTKEKMLRRYRTTRFTTLVWEEPGNDETIRYFNQTELERLQTVPEGYTKCLTRNEAANVLGDGWTVDVIAHIIKNLKEEFPMFKCKDVLEQSSACGKLCCCFDCEDKDNCKDICNLITEGVISDPKNCESAIESDTAVKEFESKTVAVIKAIAAISTKKKELEQQDKLMRE